MEEAEEAEDGDGRALGAVRVTVRGRCPTPGVSVKEFGID